MFASHCNPSSSSNPFVGTPFAAAPFDLNAVMQNLAQSDLPSFVNDILLNLATAASTAQAKDDTSISSDAQDKRAANEASSPQVRQPRLDLSTTASSPDLKAVLELPGFAKSDVSIALQPGKLVVTAEKQAAPASPKGKERAVDQDDKEEPAVEWRVRERQTGGKWVRELPLAAGVKPDAIKASMHDGVLTITYPKEATIQPEQTVYVE